MHDQNSRQRDSNDRVGCPVTDLPHRFFLVDFRGGFGRPIFYVHPEELEPTLIAGAPVRAGAVAKRATPACAGALTIHWRRSSFGAAVAPSHREHHRRTLADSACACCRSSTCGFAASLLNLTVAIVIFSIVVPTGQLQNANTEARVL